MMKKNFHSVKERLKDAMTNGPGTVEKDLAQRVDAHTCIFIIAATD
jgi:hypothetical protein